MKKFMIFAALAALVMGVMACGSKKDADDAEGEAEAPQTIEVMTTSVKGALGDYFTVVDKPYKISNDGSFTILTVEVERNDTPTPYLYDDICYFPNGKKSEASMCGGFGYELLDEDGNVIAKGSPTSSTSVYSWDDVEEALRSRSGETSSIRFSIYEDNISPKSIRITSDLQPNSEKAMQTKAVTDDFDDAVEEISSSAKESMKDVEDAIKAEKEALEMLNNLFK